MFNISMTASDVEVDCHIAILSARASVNRTLTLFSYPGGAAACVNPVGTIRYDVEDFAAPILKCVAYLERNSRHYVNPYGDPSSARTAASGP
ncbi:hypothetical protein DFJ77DRAFT_515507 [Powellomyces hirtus]|nr:hypothetical protein DFJ77DRAFT_515507 [Powellomyces hirtus]